MKTRAILLLMALPLFALISCSDGVDMSSPDGKVEYRLMLSDINPVQLTEAQKTFANDNNQFALDFLRTVDEADNSGKSFIYSPLSITYVLSMVNDAAEGATQRELEQTLGFHEGGIDAVNQYCKTLIEKLPNVDKNVQLNIANAIFLNKQFTLKQQFQQDMQQYYHAKAEALDFSSPKTLSHINGWCNEQTHGMIPAILEEVRPDAVSYLLNAIYFKSDWTLKFDEKNTHTETFTTEHGDTKQIPLMHHQVLINYMKNEVFSLIDIPYGNGMWNMSVMLHEEGKSTTDVIQWLVEKGWAMNDKDRNSDFYVTPYKTDLKLPRFKTNSDTNQAGGKTLIDLLQSMGIQRAFTTMAEIPNMCEQDNVFISMMRQKAAIEVNEKGAEAAAVTIAETMSYANPDGGESEEPRLATFHANRPFVYVIREASSGILLFVGKFTGQ